MTAGRIVLLTCLALVVLRCAKQTTPTGGPKDETPPKLISSSPKANQVNYTKSTIELTFDELVQVNNPREELLIVPSVGKKFDVRARKNKVFINLNATLDSNTTYLLNFRESIQDLNERNTAKNLKLAFSTGNLLDSLKLSGKVFDLLKGSPQDEFTVAAVLQDDSLNIFKRVPTYITKSGEDGTFALENLKQGYYHIYAFDDVNNNLIVDSRTEAFGFLPDSVSLTDSLPPVSIQTVRLDVRPLQLTNARPQNHQFVIRLTKGIASYELRPGDSSYALFSDQPEPSFIRIYQPEKPPGNDSLAVRLLARDSLAQQLDTVVFAKFGKSSAAKDKFSLQIKRCVYEQNKGMLRAELLFTKPVARINYDSIYIRLDSIQAISFSAENVTWKSSTTALLQKNIGTDQTFTYTAARKPLPDKNLPDTRNFNKRDESSQAKAVKARPFNQLIIASPSIISAEGDTLLDNTSVINIIKPETSGTILVQTKSKENLLIQLLNKNAEVIHESLDKSVVFDNLTPGEYILRAIIDENQNGKWDAGNWFTRQQPETALFYTDEKGNRNITLKANWELGPLLITY